MDVRRDPWIWVRIPVPPPIDSGNQVKKTQNKDVVVTELREHKSLVNIVDINDSFNAQSQEASKEFLKRFDDYIDVLNVLYYGRPLMEVVDKEDCQDEKTTD